MELRRKGLVLKMTLSLITMVIVIYMAVAVITGVNPLSVFRQIGNIFEPSKINIADDDAEGLDKYVKLDCEESAIIVILDSAKFYYKSEPSSSTDSVNFVIILDYRNTLFPGIDAESGKSLLTCGASEDSKSFQCPQDRKLEFSIENVELPEGKQIFHFTIWLVKNPASPEVLSNIDPPVGLRELLQGYSEYYVSSFDVVKDVNIECQATKCEEQDNQISCQDTPNCYWGGWSWSKSCGLCPTSVDCDDYDRDQCEQCPIPKRDCHVTLTGGCELR